MKLHALALLALLSLVSADPIARRQNPPPAANPAPAPAPTAPPAAPPAAPAPPPPPPANAPVPPPSAPAPTSPPPPPPANGPPPPNGPPPVNGPPPGAPALAPTPAGPPPAATNTGIPSLASISLGMPTRPALPAVTSYPPGTQPPIPGAPVLPPTLVLGSWPPQDKVPDTTSPEVQQWLKELTGHTIPNIAPTVDGSCGGDPAAAADASNRGWWTCGGYTRATDIVACPDKWTWGVSFDDGPSQYTQYLLNYLSQKSINATFFVVGSRCIEQPNLLIEEYMSGHEISVHTWSHRPLTSLTNEQIVAELGWTRKAIKDIIGVTPTTMRPPYGDIDDRVRAISMAMGMIPIMWTRSPSGGTFDTNDWRVAGGLVGGQDSFNTFESILSNASTLDTGFIVLQHDLFEITVDLAIGYTLDAALNHEPKFNLKSIGQCQKLPAANLYLETNTNVTFPYRNTTTGGGVDVTGDGTIDSASGGGNTTTPSSASKASNVKSSAASTLLNSNAIPLLGSLMAVGLGAASLVL